MGSWSLAWAIKSSQSPYYWVLRPPWKSSVPINISMLEMRKLRGCSWSKRNPVVPQFMNAFIFERFGSQTEAFDKILFWLQALHWVMSTTAVSFPHTIQTWPSFPELWT